MTMRIFGDVMQSAAAFFSKRQPTLQDMKRLLDDTSPKKLIPKADVDAFEVKLGKGSGADYSVQEDPNYRTRVLQFKNSGAGGWLENSVTWQKRMGTLDSGDIQADLNIRELQGPDTLDELEIKLNSDSNTIHRLYGATPDSDVLQYLDLKRSGPSVELKHSSGKTKTFLLQEIPLREQNGTDLTVFKGVLRNDWVTNDIVFNPDAISKFLSLE